MKVIFYGRFADSIGREIDFDVPEFSTVAELRVQLDCAFPGKGLADRRVGVCVAGTFVSDGLMLPPHQIIEILAPVSGG